MMLLQIVAIICFILAAVPIRGPWLPVGLAFFAAGHIWSQVVLR